MELRDIINRFNVDRKISETSYQCKCPHHYDNKASLTITEKDGKILFYCHAGCETEDILKDVGLEMADLTITPTAAQAFGSGFKKDLEAEYKYYDNDGNYAYSKLRYKGKKMFYGVVDGKDCRFKGVTKERYLYNLQELKKAIEQDKPVYYVEGEKDVETLKKIGLTATTAGGVGDWKSKFKEHFKGAWVNILADNDEPGQKLAEKVANSIKNTCYCYRIITPSNEDHGDVTDYLQAGNSKESLLDLVETEPWTTTGEKVPPPLEMHTAAELMKMDLKPPRFIINGLLPAGVAILAAPSKMGKSWLVMDIGLSVVEGKSFMGFQTNKCEVVYFALEDSWTRLKGRLQKLTGFNDPPDGFTLVTKCEPIHNGFLHQVEQVMQNKPKTGLIIIDTLQKVKPPTDRNKTAYEQDYEVFNEISKLAIKHNVCILFLHHTRKTNGIDGDPFENILGSTALQGATDAMYIIKKRKRTDEEAFFYATGRDIDPQELMVKFSKETCRWENLGEADSIEQMWVELEYRNHPAMLTLHYKLDSIEADPDEPIKEYVTTMKDFRNDTIEHTGQVVGTSAQNFRTIVGNFDPYLLKEKIRHIEPEGTTTYKNRKGRFHRYKKG